VQGGQPYWAFPFSKTSVLMVSNSPCLTTKYLTSNEHPSLFSHGIIDEDNRFDNAGTWLARSWSRRHTSETTSSACPRRSRGQDRQCSTFPVWNFISKWSNFIYLMFYHLDVLSTWYSINLTLSWLVILSTWCSVSWHSVNFTLDISSTWHFVNLTFCQLDILSTWHFVNLTFCQLDISLTPGCFFP
jgi:hypothetical protein